MSDEGVHDIIAKLRPSARGDLTYDVLPGWWTDAGTFESLARANALLRGREGG